MSSVIVASEIVRDDIAIANVICKDHVDGHRALPRATMLFADDGESPWVVTAASGNLGHSHGQ
jgi:hypothetical protein